MNAWLTAAPILIPMLTAALCMVAWKHPVVQRGLSLLGSIALVAAGGALLSIVLNQGIQVVQMGAWAAPFGITLVADPLSALMVLIAAVMGFCVALHALGDIDPVREKGGHHAVFQILMTGVCGAFVTGDLFNLYVWFEVMLISSFVLLSLGGLREQIDAAIKYVAINMVATACLLLAVALLYGVTGTLNMADLSIRVPEVPNQPVISAIAVLFIIAFGMKAALFPFFFWLPATYHTPSVAVQAIFAGLLTKVGVYALMRVFTLIFTGDSGWTHGILMVMAGITMIVGVLGSLAARDLNRAWSWQVVAHIGSMVMGLAIATPLALAAAAFYMVHDIIVKTNLFLGAGLVRRLAGGSTDYARLGGLFKTAPWLCLLLFVPLGSLAGFPPLSGFWGKLLLVRAGLETEHYVMVGLLLVTGLLTIWLVGRVWAEMVWKAPAEPPAMAISTLSFGRTYLLILPLLLLSLITVSIGLQPERLLNLAGQVGHSLTDTSAYVQAVLGTTPSPQPTLLGALETEAMP
ncbi:Na+/H+ antiporter subunit D [Niveispirillum lacus]|uniref:Na+/H+ antiporter subunit D n=1 Tax=Niveispirillum lacus TaxID=1981099 RepID=A0A255YZS5_9PROT|nr:proton-conducting transporter membrane subunit [Niveispirillum lacus]OYQ34184.1 Na+/H+ antiporter subunit D [Niveispirillum lacus]